MKKGLNATTLKIIAILAMVCDHTAWGFVELLSVQGQIMHTIGRLTIPIMCFFIAEGYRRTSNLRNYIYRMVLFAAITIVPFYLFFGEEYGYRQNIIFDYLLALLALTIIDSPTLKKSRKIILAALVFITSALVGGWPILPILFVLAFYYGKSFQQKAFLVTTSTILVEVVIISLILLNNHFHFSSYDWVWYQWLYFLGFVLALPLLARYNGERGKLQLGRYFFYMFYPAHFLVLYSIKILPSGDLYTPYLLLHIVSLVFAVAVVVKLLFARPSRALIISILLAVSCAIYVFGFILETMAISVDFAYAGIILEYFGECIVFMSFLFFIAELCHRKIPTLIYMLSGFFSVFIVSLVTTTSTTGLFYSKMQIDYSGPFPRLDLSYGPGFYLFVSYMVLVCGGALVMGIMSLKNFQGIDRKRIILVMCAITCPWFAFLIKLTGITGGYEISTLGVIVALLLIYKAIVSYGYFDSIQLAGENALHHFGDGVLVVDNMNKILYINRSMLELFPELQTSSDINDNPNLLAIVKGSMKSSIRNGHIYDANVTPLTEQGYTQGYMITTKDMTEHYEHLREAERFANTDALTGLSNRSHFKQNFDKFRATGGIGCMLMFDLDNFKGVNDTYGHGVGDKVLVTLAETIKNASMSRHLSCRIGGDEFCMFLKNVTDAAEIEKICMAMIKDFLKRLASVGLLGITSISIGAAVLDSKEVILADADFKDIYKKADNALYVAKNSGKGTYRLYSE